MLEEASDLAQVHGGDHCLVGGLIFSLRCEVGRRSCGRNFVYFEVIVKVEFSRLSDHRRPNRLALVMLSHPSVLVVPSAVAHHQSRIVLRSVVLHSLSRVSFRRDHILSYAVSLISHEKTD